MVVGWNTIHELFSISSEGRMEIANPQAVLNVTQLMLCYSFNIEMTDL